MRIKEHVLLQYTLSTLVVIVVFSMLLGSVIARWTSDIQIKKHLDLYPQITDLVLDHHPEASSSLAQRDYTDSFHQMQDLVDDMLNFEGVFRVKLWGENGIILWSDDPSIIGKQFADNEEFKEAWNGQMSYSISTPDDAEKLSESSHSTVMEIYSPVLYQGKVVGVFEMYEATDILFKEIQSSMRMIWLAVGAFGIVIYILLFMIFYRAHTRQLRLNEDLQRTQDITIMSLAAVAETRDHETGRHILRTSLYIDVLANGLKYHPRFKEALKGNAITILSKSCPLHDIGKVGVPDQILRKPGKLTPEEFDEIKKHPIYGRDALSVAEKEMGTNTFLETAREIAYTHHEKWDGSGYPEGLKGDEIPISGRLMAIVDVYDALVSERVYKKAYSHEESIDIIREGRGQHFDPDATDAFLALEAEFKKIASELAD